MSFENEAQFDPPIEPVVIDGVPFFGVPGREISVDDLERLAVPLDKEVYFLKHFASLPPGEEQAYLGQQVTVFDKEFTVDQEFIDHQLASAGSKFNSRIEQVASPKRLLQFVRTYLPKVLGESSHQWLDVGGYKRVTIPFVITPEIKREAGIPLDEAMGTASMVEITPENEGLVFEEIRSGVEQTVLKKIAGLPMPTTDKIIIALKWADGEPAPELVTVYSGSAAPNFPNPEKQSPE